MPRAVLKDGEIRLIDPIPQQWRDGQALRVEVEPAAGNPTDVETRLAEFEALCDGTDAASDDQLNSAIDEIRRHGKEQIRREMGLP